MSPFFPLTFQKNTSFRSISVSPSSPIISIRPITRLLPPKVWTEDDVLADGEVTALGWYALGQHLRPR
jgi:hypothetical protein